MNAKDQEILTKLRSTSCFRLELLRLRADAQVRWLQGDLESEKLLDAIDQTKPSDDLTVFMGFCPYGLLKNRLDTQWKTQNICTFDFHKSEIQIRRFNKIFPGDLVILKKREVFAVSMRLYGFGRVENVQTDQSGSRSLLMNWSHQGDEIVVPLMGCNSTVNVKSRAQVGDEMPAHYFDWLDAPKSARLNCAEHAL